MGSAENPIEQLKLYIDQMYSNEDSQRLDNRVKEKMNREMLNIIILSEGLDKHYFNLLSNAEVFDMLVKLKTLFESILLTEGFDEEMYQNQSMKKVLEKIIHDSKMPSKMVLSLHEQLMALSSEEKNMMPYHAPYDDYVI